MSTYCSKSPEATAVSMAATYMQLKINSSIIIVCFCQETLKGGFLRTWTRRVLLQRMLKAISLILAQIDPLKGATLKAISEGLF